MIIIFRFWFFLYVTVYYYFMPYLLIGLLFFVGDNTQIPPIDAKLEEKVTVGFLSEEGYLDCIIKINNSGGT